MGRRRVLERHTATTDCKLDMAELMGDFRNHLKSIHFEEEEELFPVVAIV